MEHQEEIKTGLFEVTIEDIVALFSNYSDKKKAKDIKNAFKLTHADGNLFSVEIDIDKRIDSILREDQKRGSESELIYSKSGKYYTKRRPAKLFDGVPPQHSEYVGRAGECAVMSELLFRNYNVNRMMVDDGVDLVAVKDNIYYYVQVKTPQYKEGRIYTQISNANFDKFLGKQLRYIIVVRVRDKANNGYKNIFFKFSQEDIDKGVFDRCIKRGESAVSIKIKFDEKSGAPKLYDEKEQDISWHMNNFDL